MILKSKTVTIFRRSNESDLQILASVWGDTDFRLTLNLLFLISKLQKSSITERMDLTSSILIKH